jgi:urea transport system permease protein
MRYGAEMKTLFFRKTWQVLTLWLLIMPSLMLGQDTATDPVFSSAMAKLAIATMQERAAAVEQLASLKHPRVVTTLKALLDSHLYVLKADGKVVIVEESQAGFHINNAETGQDLGQVEHEAVQKITVTNSIRTALRESIGRLELDSNEPEIRLSAIQAIAKATDESSLQLLRNRLEIEQDEDVQAELKRVLALASLASGDKATRLEAIDSLQQRANQDVVNRLTELMEKDAEGNYVESDSDIRNRAKAAFVKINSQIQFNSAIETLFFGLSLGAVLVLAAIGLAITFGVMGVINMAHGELMMLGAYTTYVMQQLMPGHLGLALILSIPAAFIISGLVGIAIERGIIRFLYGRPLETLLATFGVSLFLQQTVRSIFSPLNRSVTAPDWMSGTWQVNDFLAITWSRFYILIFCLLVFVLLLQLLKRTRLGLEVRAVAQNRNMAKAMGIPTAWVDALTFGLGSGIAGIAGVALSQITNVGPNLGQSYIVDSFMVVVFGGVGNLWGTLLAGFSLGVANKLLEPYAGAVLAKILVLVFIILFIQKYPRGLFPQKGRAVEG